MTKDMNAKLNAFATSYYRIMLNTIGLEKVSKVRIYDLTDNYPYATDGHVKSAQVLWPHFAL